MNIQALSTPNYSYRSYLAYQECNVAIYCRLSKDDNCSSESMSISNQRDYLKSFVETQHWNLVDVYIDDADILRLTQKTLLTEGFAGLVLFFYCPFEGRTSMERRKRPTLRSFALQNRPLAARNLSGSKCAKYCLAHHFFTYHLRGGAIMPKENNCKVVAVSNQKGGTGKSFTCANLGVGLAKAGKKVAIIDLDSQANLTMSFGFNPEELPITISHILTAIMNRNFDFKKSDYILHAEGVDIVPSDIALSGVENTIINSVSRENVLKKFIATIKDDYEVILLDCMPSLNIVTINALTAADEVLIPVQAHYLSAKGLELLLKTIIMVREELNPALSIAGILITMVDGRANFPKELIKIVEEAYGNSINIFDSKIPMSIKATETQAAGKSIYAFDPKCRIAESYEAFTDEFLKRECV